MCRLACSMHIGRFTQCRLSACLDILELTFSLPLSCFLDLLWRLGGSASALTRARARADLHAGLLGIIFCLHKCAGSDASQVCDASYRGPPELVLLGRRWSYELVNSSQQAAPVGCGARASFRALMAWHRVPHGALGAAIRPELLPAGTLCPRWQWRLTQCGRAPSR